MVRVTLELPEDLAAHLAAMPEAERNHFAVSAISAALIDSGEEDDLPLTSLAREQVIARLTREDVEGRTWWDSLTEEQRSLYREDVERSSRSADAGSVRPANEVFARLRAKYARPDRSPIPSAVVSKNK